MVFCVARRRVVVVHTRAVWCLKQGPGRDRCDVVGDRTAGAEGFWSVARVLVFDRIRRLTLKNTRRGNR